jgi:NADH:ubiquinone oxidoreductase subunit 4 (subunit M)
VTALIIQAAGGAMASIADTHEDAERGGNIMLAGIIIQLGMHALIPTFLRFFLC